MSDVTDCVTNAENLQFHQFSFTEVHEALVKPDVRTPSDPGNLDHYILKVSADLIAFSLTHIYNPTIVMKELLSHFC